MAVGIASARKSELSVIGQIDIGEAVRSTITVLELNETGCRVRETLPELTSPSSLEVWLGAIGPLHAHVSASSRNQIEFDGAIHSSIVKHFCS